MDKTVKVWFDAEGDFLEVIFSDAPGLMVATNDEALMKRISADGDLLGFSIPGVSRRSKDKHPLEASLGVGTAA